ncbi:MAG TPA: 2-hydroxymuconate tautomerase family protein [Nitrospirota bacterium]|nr:2-hydroxymuconate tautomerase family protein [Nitrospirota bacterium]
MPIVQIDMLQRTVEQKREMVKRITQAIVEIANVPPESVTIIIRDMPKENLGKAGLLRCDS